MRENRAKQQETLAFFSVLSHVEAGCMSKLHREWQYILSLECFDHLYDGFLTDASKTCSLESLLHSSPINNFIRI